MIESFAWREFTKVNYNTVVRSAHTFMYVYFGGDFASLAFC